MAVDGAGNVLLVGVSGKPLTSGYAGSFVTKLDAAGAPIWSVIEKSPDYFEREALAVAANGNEVAVVGADWVYAGTEDGYPVSKSFATLYDAAGHAEWSQRGSGGKSLGVAVDGAGNVFVGGAGAGVWPPDAGYRSAAFITSVTGGGALRWTNDLTWLDPSWGSPTIRALAVDACGEIVAGGIVVESGLWTGQPDVDRVLVVKLDPLGQPLWARAYRGGTDGARGIAVRTSTIAITGTFAGKLDFGEGPLDSASDASLCAGPPAFVATLPPY